MTATFLGLLFLSPASAFAPFVGEIVVVDTVEDSVDFGGAQQVADLPGPDGRISFREAVAAANNTPGAQSIHFAIPQSEWWLYPDRALLRVEQGAFVLSDDATTVDFATQAAFTGDTNPSGGEVGMYGVEPNGLGSPAIVVTGDQCLFRGLDVVQQRGYAIQLRGDENRVVGCTISGPLFAAVHVNGAFNGDPAERNAIGGVLPGEGNRLSAGNSGVRIDGPARDNVVIGNTLTGSSWGAEVRTPTCCAGNDAVGNRIGGPGAGEGNVIAGAGHYGEEGFPTGGQVGVQYSTGTIVEGNLVGVLADGTTVPATQRGPVGVELRSSPGSLVRDNTIAGILVVGVNHYQGQRFGIAVHVRGDCAGSAIEGSRIGVAADGVTPVPNRAGIVASYWSVDGSPVVAGPIAIGGTAAGQGNVVAHSETTGVRVDSQIETAAIRGNSIHSNGGLGIDLLATSGGSGPTPNDPGDADTGGNELQNFPVLLAALRCDDSITIAGTLSSAPDSTYDVDFFANAACDPSGFGEGETFLGSTAVRTDGSGSATFRVTLAQSVLPGASITATATDALGNTSELSECRASARCDRRLSPPRRDPIDPTPGGS